MITQFGDSEPKAVAKWNIIEKHLAKVRKWLRGIRLRFERSGLRVLYRKGSRFESDASNRLSSEGLDLESEIR